MSVVTLLPSDDSALVYGGKVEEEVSENGEKCARAKQEALKKRF